MEAFLSLYADTKAQIILEQDWLEGGISIPEEITEDENEDSDHGEDDDDLIQKRIPSVHKNLSMRKGIIVMMR